MSYMGQMMSYDKSPIPPEKSGGPANERNPDRAIRDDGHGGMTYDSAAASGHVEIELPALPGSPNATERLHVRSFGPFVIGKLEAAMRKQPYMKTGATQNAAQVLRHYTAVAKGAQLMNKDAIGRMETLAKEFEEEPDREAYFEAVVRPYLLHLTPTRRR